MDFSTRTKVHQGDIVEKWPRVPWNRLMDMLEWYERTIPHSIGKTAKPPLYRSCNAIRIKNATEATLSRGNIVGINGSRHDPTDENELPLFKTEPVFVGSAPTFPENIGKFAIVLEELPADAIGYAAISGVTWCQVEMDFQGRRFADIDPDGVTPTTKLFGNEYGGAEILYIEDENEAAIDWTAGTKNALVRLGSFNDPDLIVSWSGDLEFGTEKTAYVHDADGPTDRTIPLYGSIIGSFSGQLLAIVTPGEMAWAHFHRESGLYELGANTRMFESINDPP